MTNGTPSVSDAAASKPALDIHEILKILPHRYPLLLIDRVLELKRKERIVAIKNVSINEPFFNGHFPGLPIMPGVLIVEAIAQAGGALLLTEVEDRENKVMVFTGIERAKFRRPVSPGDQLRIEVACHSADDRGKNARRRLCCGQARGGSNGVLPIGRQLARPWRRP
jgi:3-hydroxyacyl-[acyl-carrier-protein] dehydratase